MYKTFDTPEPISLYVELGSGDLYVDAAAVAETTVTVDGQDADDVTVEQRGNQVVVIAPHRRGAFLGLGRELSVRVTLPTDSELTTKLGSADLDSRGRLGACRLKSGSGDVRLEELGGDTTVEAGSGDVEIETTAADLRVKTGSGDVEVERLGGTTTISTGSGDVEVGRAQANLQVKSGSGSVRLKQSHADIAVTTASGDVVLETMNSGALAAKNVSGDIHVGVPPNIPVWTDLSCVTGHVSSNLQGAGQPAEGQEFIELRAKTVSGDIVLEQL